MSFASDHPPNSRLFILCSAKFTEADIRKEFEKFGQIEDCWFVPDKSNKKQKGVCYVKYARSSEACRAMEEMDEQQLLNEPRPIKVKMAGDRQSGNRRESDSECWDRLRCLFVRVPSSDCTEQKIVALFEQYGRVEGFNYTRSKMCGYVTFEKPSQAAAAIEQCPKEFAAMFVDPDKSTFFRKPRPDHRDADHRGGRRSRSPPRRAPLVSTPPGGGGPAAMMSNNYYPCGGPAGGFSPPRQQQEQSGRFLGGILPAPNTAGGSGPYGPAGGSYVDNGAACGDFGGGDPMKMTMMGGCSNNPTRCQELYVKINYPLARETAWRLCNLVPCLEAVHLVKTVGENSQLHTIFLVRYSSASSAGWAWEKLQDLEYPPGHYIRVRYADTGFPKDWDIGGPISNMNTNTTSATTSSTNMVPAPTPVPLPVPGPVPAPGYNMFASSELHNNDSFSTNHQQQQQHQSSNVTSDGSVLSTLVNTIAAGGGQQAYEFGGVQCSVKLSYPKALLPNSTPYEARLFFLNTRPVPDEVLEDAFSTFGDLITLYSIPGKNCGYAMYASQRAAEAALATMNNATLAGSKLKILQADQVPDSSHKRARIENAQQM